MRRTSVLLDDDLAALLAYEGRRRDRSIAAIVREALAAYLASGSPTAGRLPFAALGGSGKLDTARKAEEILAGEWGGQKKTGAKRSRR